MARHLVANLVASESVLGVVVVDVVWELRLVENSKTVVSVPDSHVSKGVLNSKAISDDIVAIDDDAARDWVHGVFDGASNVVVSAPQPGVVNDHVATVDFNHAVSRGLSAVRVVSTANASKNIGCNAWVLSIAIVLGLTPLEQC